MLAVVYLLYRRREYNYANSILIGLRNMYVKDIIFLLVFLFVASPATAAQHFAQLSPDDNGISGDDCGFIGGGQVIKLHSGRCRGDESTDFCADPVTKKIYVYGSL